MPDTRTMSALTCPNPRCAELNLPAAIVCAVCGYQLIELALVGHCKEKPATTSAAA